ncbi:MAG: hypothetical protein MUC75_03220 [Ignavibacteriaceae bacterium]|jgi:hypothetical protein|nr:hypothetical protein [Ignavibacteriaceae bacterium]
MNRKILLKYFSWIGFTLSITTFLILCFSGCSSRRDKPVILNDSTIVYPSKYEGGLQSKITLTKRVSKKTGKPIKPGTRFNLQEDTKLFAIVDLEKQTTKQNRDLMFHIDWVDSSGNSFYKKRIDISIKDTSSRIISSISLSPQKRQPGNYTARLYLFRELIAEKRFLLVESLSDTLIVKKKSVAQDTSITIKKVKKEKLKKSEIKSDNIMASLVLCRKISKKTGNPVGAATTFTIKEKAKVKAVVSIEKQDIKTNEQMKFYFNWIGPDGKSFYKKRVVYSTSNPFFTVSNSISITPEKRQPGKYKVRVSYRKKIIAEQKFELVLPEKQESL